MLSARHLLLWDIDRTLIDVGGISREVYAEAFQAVTGQRLQQIADLAGRTDHDIILQTLALHGVQPAEAKLNAFYEALARAVQARHSQMRQAGRALPGAKQVLEAFAGMPGVVQTVVTGNIRPVAEQKLLVFDLAAHLDADIGGYGSDDGERAGLVRLAISRAHVRYGVRYELEQVVVIGDTAHDVVGARACGVRAVGVATGGSTMDELRAAEAHVVLPDLADTGAVVRAVLAT